MGLAMVDTICEVQSSHVSKISDIEIISPIMEISSCNKYEIYFTLCYLSVLSLFLIPSPLSPCSWSERECAAARQRYEQEYAAGGELVADTSGVVEQSGHGGMGGAAAGGGVADVCRGGPTRAWPASALRTTLSSASAVVSRRAAATTSRTSTSVSVVHPSISPRLPSNNEQHDEKRQEKKVHVVCARSNSLANVGATSAADGGNARRTTGGRPMRRPAMVPRG
jgi:hypothetical protein